MLGSLARRLTLLHHPNLAHALTAFADMNDLKQLHAQLLISGSFFTDMFTVSRFLVYSAISDSGDICYARSLFTQIEKPNLFLFNTMIRGFSQSNQPIDAIKFYNKMLLAGISPDNFTFPFLVKSCSVLSCLDLGKGFHGQIIWTGLNSDVFVVNNLINMYSNCGVLDLARQLFDESSRLVDVVSWTALVTGFANSGDIIAARWFFDRIPSRNLVSWNAMIAGYAQCGKIDDARQLFDEMPQRSTASWSAMISGYSKSGLCKEALELFKEMVGSARVMPNEPAIVSTVSACSKLRALDQGRWVHSYIEENNFKINVTLGTALIDMYGKCGSIEGALHVFEMMPNRNLFTWNSMIASLALHGCGKQALGLFGQLVSTGLMPNGITFIGVLSACSHTGLVKEGRQCFDLMTRVYGIKPQLEHYGCMVDLLGRAGLLDEALSFIESMPVEPHSALWGALVGACRIHSNVELGEELGKRLIELEPHHSGRYVLLSNIYAAARRWDDVDMIRSMMKERGVLKTPGNSAVEVNGIVNRFFVGDRLHPQAREIYLVLDEIMRRIAVAGYKPEKQDVLFDLEEEEREDALRYHSEKLAIAFGFIAFPSGVPIRIVKNLRFCGDCHSATKFISKVYDREIIVRDRNRFHHFRNGSCSCSDYW